MSASNKKIIAVACCLCSAAGFIAFSQYLHAETSRMQGVPGAHLSIEGWFQIILANIGLAGSLFATIAAYMHKFEDALPPGLTKNISVSVIDTTALATLKTLYDSASNPDTKATIREAAQAVKEDLFAFSFPVPPKQ